MRHGIRYQAWILVAALAAFFVNLGGPRLWDDDESKNATCARDVRAWRRDRADVQPGIAQRQAGARVLADDGQLCVVRDHGIRRPSPFGLAGAGHRADDVSPGADVVSTASRAVGRTDHGLESDVRRGGAGGDARLDAHLLHDLVAHRLRLVRESRSRWRLFRRRPSGVGRRTRRMAPVALGPGGHVCRDGAGRAGQRADRRAVALRRHRAISAAPNHARRGPAQKARTGHVVASSGLWAAIGGRAACWPLPEGFPPRSLRCGPDCWRPLCWR